MAVKFPTGPAHQGKVGPYQKAVDEVQDYIRQLNFRATRAIDSGQVIKLGEEELSVAAARNRFRSGTDADRQAFVSQYGQEETLKLIRGPGGEPSPSPSPSPQPLPLGNTGGMI
jgi:hypothetical protein